jgi:hypothetical protein
MLGLSGESLAQRALTHPSLNDTQPHPPTLLTRPTHLILSLMCVCSAQHTHIHTRVHTSPLPDILPLPRSPILGLSGESLAQRAFSFFRLAAGQGNVGAELRLGDYYYYGQVRAHITLLLLLRTSGSTRSVPPPPSPPVSTILWPSFVRLRDYYFYGQVQTQSTINIPSPTLFLE